MVVLLFLSSFPYFPFDHEFNSSEEREHPFSFPEYPPSLTKWMETLNIQSPDTYINNFEKLEMETLIKVPLVLFGKLTYDYHEKKLMIREIINQNPGIGLREIQRTTGFSMGATQYHVRSLEREEIESLKLGPRKHFFLCQSSFSEYEKKWLAITRNQNIRKILQNIGVGNHQYVQKDIVQCTGLSKAMVSYYVKYLRQVGIIDSKYPHLSIMDRYVVMNTQSYWENR